MSCATSFDAHSDGSWTDIVEADCCIMDPMLLSVAPVKRTPVTDGGDLGIFNVFKIAVRVCWSIPFRSCVMSFCST